MKNSEKSNRVVIDRERALRAKSASRDEIDEILGEGEILTEDGAEILATIENRGLNLNGLTEISSASLVTITRTHKNYIALDGLTKLPEEFTFEERDYEDCGYSDYNPTRTIYLNGLTGLTRKQIDFIYNIAFQELELNSVTQLPDNTSWRLACWHYSPYIDLSSLNNASCNVLENLVESAYGGSLNLSGLNQVNEEQAKILSKIGHESDCQHGGLIIGIREFKSIDVATIFAESEIYSLSFNRLESIDLDIARAFAQKYEGFSLELNGIKQINDDAFKSLVTGNLSGIPDGQAPGWLSLNSLQELTPEMAKCLDGNEISLWLDGISNLPVEIAEILLKAKGSIHFGGLVFINNDLADVISQNLDVFSLSKESIMSTHAREKLAKALH